MSDKERMEAGNVTLLPSHWITIDTFAAEQSYSSTSAGLRRIIDEWLMLTGRVQGRLPTASLPEIAYD